MCIVTCFEKFELDVSSNIVTGTSRIFGRFENHKDAHNVLKTGCCDMFKTIYRYAAIRDIDTGEQWFYKYSEEKNGFCLI